MTHLPDALGFDALADELATDPFGREFSKPSLYPTCRAFIAATSVAEQPLHSVTGTARGGLTLPSCAVPTSLQEGSDG